MIKNNIVIEGARIGFRNFSGKEGKFNPAGRRNFCVFLNGEVEVSPDFNDGIGVVAHGDGHVIKHYAPLALVLELDGWNVRWLEPRDEGDEKQAYLQVAVSYANIPPKIILVTHKGKSVIDEETVNILDWADIREVDLIIRPYNWDVNGKTGVKAYVKSMYVTIEEDEFEQKYYDVPDSASDAVGGCGHCEACDGSCKDEH